jgi:hypothetical protein
MNSTYKLLLVTIVFLLATLLPGCAMYYDSHPENGWNGKWDGECQAVRIHDNYYACVGIDTGENQ